MRRILFLFLLTTLLVSCSNQNKADYLPILDEVAMEGYRVRSQPSWSADGNKLLFESGQQGHTPRRYLTLYDTATSEATNIYSVNDYGQISFNWHPSNPKLFVLSESYPNAVYFFIANLETNEIQRVGWGFARQWLGDGSGILVVREDEHYIYDVESGEFELLSNSASDVSFPPNYIDDSFNIGSFLRQGDSGLVVEVKSLDGMGGSQVLGQANGAGLWSPNSQWLATAHYETSPRDWSLTIANMSGSASVTYAIDQETDISWSSDSSTIIADNWDGELWLYEIQGATTKLDVAGREPSWSTDGSTIAFVNPDDFSLKFLDATTFELID